MLQIPETGFTDVVLVHHLTQSSEQKTVAEKLELNSVNDATAVLSTLVASAPANIAALHLLGKSDEDRAQIQHWISFGNSHLRSPETVRANLETLNGHLLSRTFMVPNYLTLADISIFALVHSTVSSLDKTAYFALPALVRWFDLIQHILPTAAPADVFPAVNFVLDAPEPAKVEAKKEPKAAKENVVPAADAKKDVKADAKKEVKVDAKKETKAAPKEEKPAADDGEPEPVKLDLRVGFIKSAKKHPDADALYVEEIDLGDENGAVRTVVSGLVRFIPLDEMQNRKVVCICNLKPVAMRGVKSEAMVLCATSTDGETVELLEPPQDCQPGDRVYFDGHQGKPEAQLNPKKKIWEKVQPHFNTDENRVARFKDLPFRTEKGVVTVKSVVKGSIK